MQKKGINFRKTLRFTIGVTAGLLIIAGCFSWYLSAQLKPAIRTGLVELLNKSTDGLYKVRFSAIHLNFLTASASVSDVVIEADPARYTELVRLKRAPDNVYTVRLNKLQIRNFHPWQVYNNKVLKISKLIFQEPNIVMVNKHYDFNEDRPPRPRISPYQFIAGKLHSLSIGEVKFTNAHFKYVDNNGPVVQADSVSRFNIRCSDYLIDANSANDASRLYLFKEIAFSLKDYKYITPDKFYAITADDIRFTTKKGLLEIDQFQLIPRYSEAKFGIAAGYARDRYTIKVDQLTLSGLDLPLYIKKQEVFAGSMNLSNGSLEVYSDNRLPKSEKPTLGRFPHQLLQKLPHRLSIGKIGLDKIDVAYAEFDRDSRQRGVIQFNGSKGEITNLTNHPRVIRKNKEMRAVVHTNLMDHGKMQVDFRFRLDDPRGGFTYTGMVGAMDGKYINKITKPLGMVQVNRGDVKQLSFNVRANEERATGTMRFVYNDLAVAVLRKDKTRNKLVRQGWVSFLANNLILDSDNPMPGAKTRIAPMNYTRQQYGSFFSYIWRTLFYGIKYSVGITPEKEAKIQDQIQKFEEMKADRLERKEARERRKRENL